MWGIIIGVLGVIGLIYLLGLIGGGNYGLRPGEQRLNPKEDVEREKGSKYIWYEYGLPVYGVYRSPTKTLIEVSNTPFKDWDLQLWRDPDNKYDKNAISVAVLGKKIGYIPRETTADIAEKGLFSELKAVPARVYLSEDGEKLYIGIHLFCYSKKYKKELAGGSVPAKPERKPRPALKPKPGAAPEAQSVETPCPHCGQMLTITPDLYNVKLECPKCGKHLIIEAPEA